MQDAGPGGVLFDRQYSYNAANQISQIAELTGTKVFGYDNIDRLTSVADAVNGNESYAFDGVGNRTASHLSNTYTLQPFNRLTATETGSYSQDANGNTVSKVEGSKRWTYSWDYENQLAQAWDRKTRVRYQYDALGRRVERNLGFGRERTKFTYDGEDVLLDDANGTQTKYLNGPGIDNKLRSKTGGTANYYLADHIGSTNALTDSNGAITSQASYDGFGNQTGSLTTRYGFTGRERDDFTGLMHYRARHYDPKLGRFISEDPIGFGGGDVNLYGYVGNRPTMMIDPSGKAFFVPLIVGGLAIGGLVLASPSTVNAPGPNDPVYYPDNPLLANAVGGQACGLLWSRFASPFLGSLWARVATPRHAPPPVRATPSFLGQETGPAVPVPHGATPGPVVNPAGKSTGFGYTGGTGGGSGLDPRVTGVRVMDPTPARGPSPGYPNGYVKYMNRSGQAVNPQTGQTIPRNDPWWHIPLGN